MNPQQTSQLLKDNIKTAESAETHLSALYSDNSGDYKDKFLKSPIFQKLRTSDYIKHTAATDTTSEIAQLATGILDYSNPMYIGRDCVSIHTTMNEKLKIRLPERGKAVETSSNVTSIQASGGETSFVEVDLDKEIIAFDEWNRSQIEDASPYLVSAQTQSVTDSLMYLESKIILDKIYSMRTSSNHAGRITKQNNTDATMDDLIDLWGLVKAKDRQPNAYIMSPPTCTALLKDENLKNSYYFQNHRVDYTTGDIGQFLGSKILVSSLVPNDFIACLDTNITLVYALRRDSLVIPTNDSKNDLNGLRISSRYGLEIGREDGLGVWY